MARYRPALALALILIPAAAQAQRAVDVQIGRWTVNGPDLTLYSAALWRNLWGPLSYSLRARALVDGDSLGRSLYGFGPEITLLRGSSSTAGLTAYGVGGVSLAWRAGESDIVALWDCGLGLEYKARSLLSATLEVRRAAEDGGFRGFWDLAEDDRQGWLLSLGFSIRWGGAPRRPVPSRAPVLPAGQVAESPSTVQPEAISAGEGLGLANRIVETALAAMGEPYRWGGTSTDEGFDCSGLVWYAYASHGVHLPRVSREQAHSGRPVPADIAELRPADILLFSDRADAVTHVGLYIGDARFIHATPAGGVRVGMLDGTGDENDRWWLARWVGARRVLE